MVAIGGGSDANFCELNREQALGNFSASAADFIAWPMNPQVHAFDNLSIMETLEAQPHTLTTARALFADKPLVVSPITLRPRPGINQRWCELPPAADHLPSHVDTRQISLFAAAWALASISTLAAAGVASITLFETVGWTGLRESLGVSLSPRSFPTEPGILFPVFHVFASLGGYTEMAAFGVPGRLAGILLHGKGKPPRVVLANLTRWEEPLELKHIGRGSVMQMIHDENLNVFYLDPGKFSNPAEPPSASPDGLRMRLPPYALCCIDLCC
jgi:hypothetical protein